MEEPSPEPRPKPRRQWIFSIPSCALKSCTFAAAARHGESKTSGRTLLVSAIVQSVSTKSCALKSCTFAAAARHGESKTMPCASGGTSSQGLPCGQPLSVSGGQEHRTPGGAASCGMHTTRIAPPGSKARQKKCSFRGHSISSTARMSYTYVIVRYTSTIFFLPGYLLSSFSVARVATASPWEGA